MQVFKLAFWAFFTLSLIAIFASLSGQNQDRLTVTLFHYSTPEYPKWVVLLGSFILGGLFSAAFFILQLVILETKNIRLRRVNRKLERAIQGFQSGPKTNQPLASTTSSPTLSGQSAGPTAGLPTTGTPGTATNPGIQTTPWTPQLVTKPSVSSSALDDEV